MRLSTCTFTHPTGHWWLACSERGLVSVATKDTSLRACEHLRKRFSDLECVEDNAATRPHRDALLAMLAGTLHTYPLPLDIEGTDMQRQVWQAISNVGYGETISYATLAKRINRRAAIRAAATACGANPVPLAIPCHRILGSDGSLKGFALGLEVKAGLLDYERENSLAKSDKRVISASEAWQ